MDSESFPRKMKAEEDKGYKKHRKVVLKEVLEDEGSKDIKDYLDGNYKEDE
jgi:hypothetical protein